MRGAEIARRPAPTGTVRVLLLTAEGCRYCQQAHALLDRLGAELPVQVEQLSAESAEGQALALREGVLFPPGIFVDGAFVQYGRPSERKLRQALAEALARRHADPVGVDAAAGT